MISIRSSVKLKGSVLDIEETKDFIVATDNTYYIYFIDKESFSIKKSLNVTAKPKPLHTYSKASNVSTKGIFNVSARDKKSSILLTTAKEIKKRKIIDNHHKDIEVTTFNNTSFVMATGGADGCVFFHDMRYMKTLGSMKIKPDFISTINFSPDGSLLLSAAYDKSVTILDMERNKVIDDTVFPDVVEDAKFFDNNKKIFIICRNGSSIIYNLKHHKIESTSNHFAHWPTRAILTDDEEYAVVGSRSNTLYIVRLEDNKKRLDINLKSDGIVSLKLFKKSQFILIGFADGTLDIVDFNILEEELEAKLKVKDYRAVKELFDKNVFLRTHPLAKKFDEAWPDVLQKIIQLITAEKIDKALHLAEPFLDDEKREEEFNFYMAQQKHVLKLNELVKEKEYVKAFQLAAKYPYLEKLKIYKQLEAYWQKLLSKARSLLEENPVFNKTKEISANNQEDEFRSLLEYEEVDIAERELVGMSSEEITAHILNHWNLDQVLVDSIKHAVSKEALEDASDEVSVYAKANYIVYNAIDVTGKTDPDKLEEVKEMLTQDNLKVEQFLEILENLNK
jgi:dsDNA-binding SOS-regulon protein